ncbi:SGNH/GDSL hydrolase family protein [Hamadaea sp.]|uniref:SGNH/GDSL hydrolase family protein n=1 Tax=Hamadaea sp. TaxID=2024425 RepID=UPI0025BEA68C|nr:SGNH/GDSL hydrolase family protein [Hamadaea sp.]
MAVELPRGGTVVLIGDSITDAGRVRTDPASLGCGYAYLVAALFAARNPGHRARFVNRGINGNRVTDLAARWADDCLAHQPDVVSVMVGINDCARAFAGGEAMPAETFAAHYRSILDQAATRGARLVLLEPFVLPVNQLRASYRPDLDLKIQVVRTLAAEFGAALIGTDALFAEAAAASSADEWTTDGVHPTPAGHAGCWPKPG